MEPFYGVGFAQNTEYFYSPVSSDLLNIESVCAEGITTPFTFELNTLQQKTAYQIMLDVNTSTSVSNIWTALIILR